MGIGGRYWRLYAEDLEKLPLNLRLGEALNLQSHLNVADNFKRAATFAELGATVGDSSGSKEAS